MSKQVAESSDPDFEIARVPWCRTLSGFVVEADDEEGVAIESLEPGTALTVQTLNSQYRLIVTDGEQGQVLVEGTARFPEPTPAVVQGSSAGGSLLKTGWIGPGLHMELRVGSHRVITSRVRTVTVDLPLLGATADDR